MLIAHDKSSCFRKLRDPMFATREKPDLHCADVSDAYGRIQRYAEGVIVDINDAVGRTTALGEARRRPRTGSIQICIQQSIFG